MKTISIQGNEGSFSHIAASSIFGKNIKLLERDSFNEVFSDVHEKLAEYCVIPIENSTYGSVYQNFDLLTKNNLHIIKEIYLIINFHLISFPGNKIEDLNELHTHPVAMGQIQSFLRKHKNLKPIEFPDTAGSVRMIKEKNLKNAAAAASRFSAEIYNMEIIEEKIQENKKNYTRFFVLSPEEEFSKDSDKTTIEFELGEESGSLHKSLEIFANENISLTKIESRPILNTQWEYLFYIDVMAGIQEERMKRSISKLKKIVKDFRILGSYKKGEYIQT